jgi:hypothetical protein
VGPMSRRQFLVLANVTALSGLAGLRRREIERTVRRLINQSGVYLIGGSGTRLGAPGLSPTLLISTEGYASANAVNFHLRSSSVVSQAVAGTTYQVVAFWDVDGKLAFGKRALPSHVWTLYTTAITLGTPDYHNLIALGIDPSGYLHVSYDMHAQALTYRRSLNPIATFDGDLTGQISMRGANESSVTYPTFINDNNGKLYFLFRDGASGNGDLYLYQYDPATTTWSAAVGAAGKLIDGKSSTDSPYWWMPVFDADNHMHLFFCWRDTSDWATNHDICYVTWDGADWTQMDGSAQPVPITPSNDGVAKPLSAGSGLLNSGWCDVDGAGHPHVVYLRRDGSGYLNPFHLWHDGSEWIETQLLTTQTVVPSGAWAWNEADCAAMNRPVIVLDRATGVAYVVAVAKVLGAGLWLLRSGSNDYEHWTKYRIYPTDVGAWEPVYDRQRWLTDGVLHLPIMEWISGAPDNDIRMLEWAP